MVNKGFINLLLLIDCVFLYKLWRIFVYAILKNSHRII